METPILVIDTYRTSSTSPIDIINKSINPSALGISYLILSIDPDPNARYDIIIGKIYEKQDIELTGMMTLKLPHLTSGVYRGINPDDKIIVRHRSLDATITVITSIILIYNEVKD